MIIDTKEHKEFLINMIDNFEVRTPGKNLMDTAKKYQTLLESIHNAKVEDEPKDKTTG